MMMGRKGSDMLSEISEDRLLALIAAYGADPLHWPESERTAAQQRAATDTPAIRQALAQYPANKQRAAQLLGITKSSLYRRLEKYGLDK